MENFSEQDWALMHDLVFLATLSTTKKDLTREELVELFNELPEDLKDESRELGISENALWGDKFIDWYEKNKM